MDKTILLIAVFGLAGCCIYLIYLFEKAQAEAEADYARLYEAYETALTNNKTEKLCRQIFLEHLKEQHTHHLMGEGQVGYRQAKLAGLLDRRGKSV